MQPSETLYPASVLGGALDKLERVRRDLDLLVSLASANRAIPPAFSDLLADCVGDLGGIAHALDSARRTPANDGGECKTDDPQTHPPGGPRV